MFKKQTFETLQNADAALWKAIADENQRQEDHIELIASENYVSIQQLFNHLEKEYGSFCFFSYVSFLFLSISFI